MKFLGKLRKKSEGFTLVELIVVLVILAIIAAFTIPAMLGFVEDARSKALLAEAREVYVSAQAVTTEWNATHNAAGDKVTEAALGSANIATPGTSDMQKGVSERMNKYIGQDLGTINDTDGPTWTVTLVAGNTNAIDSVTYVKGGRSVTVTAGEGSVINS